MKVISGHIWQTSLLWWGPKFYMNPKHHLTHDFFPSILSINCILPSNNKNQPPSKRKFAPTKSHVNLFLLPVFWPRLRVQPVEEYSNDDAILQFPRRNLGDAFATRLDVNGKWELQEIFSKQMVVVVLDGDFHPIKYQSVKNITSTKQTHPS